MVWFARFVDAQEFVIFGGEIFLAQSQRQVASGFGRPSSAVKFTIFSVGGREGPEHDRII